MVLWHVLTVVFLGLVFGSFATALVWRVPRQISWIRSADLKMVRSACPSCQKNLGVLDLIPVLSWFFLKGRCRYCREKTSILYPLIEITVLAACLGIYLVWGFSLISLIMMVAMPFLVALLVIDVRHMILPDQLNLAVFIIGLCLVLYTALLGNAPVNYGFVAERILAAGLYAGLIWLAGFSVSKILKKEALGFGDVKFFAVAGLWLGIGYLPAFLMLSGMAGVVYGLMSRFVAQKERFPFGPALIAAFYLCLLSQGTGFLSFFNI